MVQYWCPTTKIMCERACARGPCQILSQAAETLAEDCKACGFPLDPRSGICRIFANGGHERPDNCPIARRERDELFSPLLHGPTVGDVTSQAVGSGARYSAGKPPMEMIPVWIIAQYTSGEMMGLDKIEAHIALHNLGEWQRGRKPISVVLKSLDPEAWEEAAHVFKYACTVKLPTPYPMWNWAKGMPWSVPTACAVRHLLAILRGEALDPETNHPHRGHVMCNLVMLAQYEDTYPEGDDRPGEIQRKKGFKPYFPGDKPCPICGGGEGCAHSVKEREAEAASRVASRAACGPLVLDPPGPFTVPQHGTWVELCRDTFHAPLDVNEPRK